MRKDYLAPKLVLAVFCYDVITASPVSGEGNQADCFGTVWEEEF